MRWLSPEKTMSGGAARAATWGLLLRVGEFERLVLTEGAEPLGLVERGDSEVGAQGVLDDLGVAFVQSSGPHLRGAGDLGVEVDRDLALRGGHRTIVAHSAMTSKGARFLITRRS